MSRTVTGRCAVTDASRGAPSSKASSPSADGRFDDGEDDLDAGGGES